MADTEFGVGGASALRAALAEDTNSYGLLRLTQRVDSCVLTKFLYVRCHPAGVPPLAKGRLGTLVGAAKESFRPYHADIFVHSAEELTDDTADAALKNFTPER